MYTELRSRARIDAAEVEDVVAACVHQFGEEGISIARTAWLQAGLPIETAATTIDRQTHSGCAERVCCGGGLGTGTLSQRI